MVCFSSVGALVLAFLSGGFHRPESAARRRVRTIYLYSIRHVVCRLRRGLATGCSTRTGYPAVVTQLGLGKRTTSTGSRPRHNMAIYCIVICVLWHSSGLVMAILLAGLRGVDEDGLEGCSHRRHSALALPRQIVLPQNWGRPSGNCPTVPLAVSVVRSSYDAVVAMTNWRAGVTPLTVPPNSSWTTRSSARRSGWPRPRR